MRPLSLKAFVGAGWILQQLTVPAYGEGNLTEEVVVTGTRTEQSVWDSPVKVSLISREEIEKNHAQNAYEALVNVPGLDFKQPRGKEGQSVWIQGVSGNRVLVLIDGEPVSASTGSTVDITQIPTTQVERIEIVKGATSALYGSQAIGGVVNIITAKPEPGLSAKFSMDVGSWGDKDVDDGEYFVPRQRYNANLSYASDTVAIQSGLNAILSNSFLSGVDDFTKPAPKGEQVSGFLKGSFYQNDQVTHKLGYEHYIQRWTSDYFFAGDPLYKVDDVDRYTVRYSTAVDMDIQTIQWGATYEKFVNDSQPRPAEYRQAEMDYMNVDAQWDYEWGRHVFTQGFEYNYNTLVSTKDGADELTEDAVYRSLEYYLQDQITLGNLQILPGFRYQNDNHFGSKVLPKINGRYDLIEDDEKTIFVRGGVGKGYRVPNLKELYYLFDHSGLGYIVLGSEDVKPESSINYQLELAMIKTNGLALSFNLFRNNVTDMIEPESTGRFERGVAISEFQNIDKARLQGVEINFDIPLMDWLSMNGGYSYLDAQDLMRDRRLAERPRHQLKAAFDFQPIESLNILLNSRFYGDQLGYESNGTVHKTVPYSVIDFKANYALNNHLSIYGGIDNLTDTVKDYLDQYDEQPRDGRYIYTGFSLTY